MDKSKATHFFDHPVDVMLPRAGVTGMPIFHLNSPESRSPDMKNLNECKSAIFEIEVKYVLCNVYAYPGGRLHRVLQAWTHFVYLILCTVGNYYMCKSVRSFEMDSGILLV